MFDSIRQRIVQAVACAASHDVAGVYDGINIRAEFIRKHLAQIDHIVVLKTVPPIHMMSLRLMVGR